MCVYKCMEMIKCIKEPKLNKNSKVIGKKCQQHKQFYCLNLSFESKTWRLEDGNFFSPQTFAFSVLPLLLWNAEGTFFNDFWSLK